MPMAKRNSGLGRGLDSLFLSSEQQISDASASSVKLSDIDVDPGQPRKTFENQSLEQLSLSCLCQTALADTPLLQVKDASAQQEWQV